MLDTVNSQHVAVVSFMILKGNFYLCVPVCLLGFGLLVGCGIEEDAASSGNSMMMMPTQVVAVPAKTEAVADTLSLIGTVPADEMVELKSETAGIIESIHFTEGQHVEKGQLLIELDQSKLQAAGAGAARY